MENSIEEDIILLKDFTEGNFKRDKLENYKGSYKMGYFYYKDIQQALEHILSDYKRVLKENEEWDRKFCDLQNLYFKLQDESELKRKEYQETYKDVREELKELKKENEELKSDNLEYQRIQDIFDKRTYRKKYLEERRKEEPNLLYPDADEIYRRYYELKKENQQLRNEYINIQQNSYIQGRAEEQKKYFDLINKIEDKIDKFDYEFEKAKRKNDEDRANYYWDLIRNFKKILESEE